MGLCVSARVLDPDERDVVLVGAGIAAASGVVLLGSLFVGWYSRAGFCALTACPQVARTGWVALGATIVVLLLAALMATLPLVGVLRGDRVAGLPCAVAAIAALGAGLLIVFRITVAPDAILGMSEPRLAGPFIALLGAVGVAGGSVLVGIGLRPFQQAPRSAGALLIVVCASVGIIVSLLMPWVRRVTVASGPGPHFAEVRQTAWQASSTLAVLLLLGSIALVCASGLVAAIRWRVSFFGLAAGGWIAAAIAVAGTALVVQTRVPGVVATGVGAYEPGYYLCLGGAAVIVAVGVWTAVWRRGPRS